MSEKLNFWQRNSLYFALFTALSSVLGSLYFSEIMKYPPCILCWYQRIAMYPLVVILAVGIYLKEKRVAFYVLPFSIIGIFIALYHNLLYYKVLPESNAPCMLGVSCTTKYIEYFGFVTIPFLSLIAFVVITLCMVGYMKSIETNKNTKLKVKK